MPARIARPQEIAAVIAETEVAAVAVPEAAVAVGAVVGAVVVMAEAAVVAVPEGTVAAVAAGTNSFSADLRG